MKKEFKFATIIPLIGGFGLAAENVTGKPPEVIFSYKPFYDNDKLYLKYLNDHNKFPPYVQLDDRANDKIHESYQNLDFAVGVPPCSGLSQASNLAAGSRGSSPVNCWMYNAAEFMLGKIKPTVYTFENAPILYGSSGTPVRNILIEIAKKHGYATTFYKTNTFLHGIPQRRIRTYVIFVKGQNAPILEYFNKPSKSIADYLDEIPADATLQNEYSSSDLDVENFEIMKFMRTKVGDNWREELFKVRDHADTYGWLTHNNLLEEFKQFVEADPTSHPTTLRNINHVIKKLGDGKNFRLSHRWLCIDKTHIYSVIGESMERNIHPTYNRKINVREYLHLMGMGFDFQIEDKKDYVKLTQNCPVATNEDIIREVIEIINGNRKFSSERILYQDNTAQTKIKTKPLF